MARERPRRQSSTAHERVSVRPASRARKTKPREPRPTGRLRRFTGALFGVTRTITIDGVKYRERSRVSLERSLGPRGKGAKAYEVRFPAGRPMTINATETRRYADLMTVPSLGALTRARSHVRPGQRVLVLGAGTGAIPDLVARWTGPHGGVVALEHDHESVRYARRRYAPPSTSLERGGPELLAGELPGAFDAVIVDQAYLFACESASKAWDEIWRVVSGSGKVIHVGGGGDHPASAPRVPADIAVRSERVETPSGTVPISVLSRIPEEPNRP
jgi:precorrin-6B methylase 2